MRPGSRHNGTGSCTPQMMTNMAGTYRYGVLVKQWDGSLRVWRQNLSKDPNGPVSAAPGTPSTDSFVYFDIAIGSTLGNALGLPIQGGAFDSGAGGSAAFDDHYAFAIGVDSQDRLWITGNQHTDGWRVIRSAAANGAWDTTWQNAWVQPADFTTASGNPRFTYHIMDRTSDGTLLWFMSQEEDATATRGRDYLAFYLPPGAGTTWSKFLGTGALSAEIATTVATGPQITAAEVTDPPDPSRVADRVYITGVLVRNDSSGVEWIHIAGIWRTGDKWGNTQQKPWYIKGLVSGLGTSTNWYNVTGGSVTMPVTWANKDSNGITITSAPPVSRTFGMGLAIDQNGLPHVIVENGGRWLGPSDPTTPDNGSPVGGQMGVHPTYTNQATHPHLRLYHDGSAWQVAPITTGSIGQGRGPVPCYLPRKKDIYLVTSMSDNKHRISSKAGENVAGLARFSLPGRVWSGSEANPDPIALRNGVIAIMVPEYDTPRVYTFGNHSQASAV